MVPQAVPRQLLNPLTAVLGALVIAIGTEFTVLLLSRYWEERAKGIAHDLAMEEAVAKVGRAITASALTVASGFGALIASSFPALRDYGIVTVVDVVFALFLTVDTDHDCFHEASVLPAVPVEGHSPLRASRWWK